MEEFFKELEECLQGEVSETEKRDSLNYYREYFREQKAAGFSEQEIIQSLGSPRLIAKSIIDAHGMMEEQTQTGQGEYYDAEDERYRYTSDENSSSGMYHTGKKWLTAILIFIVVLCILGVIIQVVFPLILILIPVIFILKLIQGNRR